MRKLSVRFAPFAAAVIVGVAAAIAFVPAKTTSAMRSSVANESTPCTHRTFRKSSKEDICVKYIQQMLNTVNKAGLATDQEFGPLTRNAVIAWQKKQTSPKLKADGVVGEKTWTSLCKHRSQYETVATNAGCNVPKPLNCTSRTYSTRRNTTGPCVGLIQFLLNHGNQANLVVDDSFGAATRTAVRTWQDENNLKVDGIVGPRTWKTLCAHQMSTEPAQAIYEEYARHAGCKI